MDSLVMDPRNWYIGDFHKFSPWTKPTESPCVAVTWILISFKPILPGILPMLHDRVKSTMSLFQYCFSTSLQVHRSFDKLDFCVSFTCRFPGFLGCPSHPPFIDELSMKCTIQHLWKLPHLWNEMSWNAMTCPQKSQDNFDFCSTHCTSQGRLLLLLAGL